MKIDMAHLRERSTTGAWINFAVFDAKSTTGTDSANGTLLQELTAKARKSGLKIDQAALAFTQNGRVKFYGDKTLVNFLSANGLPSWTHQIDV